MTALRKRGRPPHAPGATTLGVRLTAEQRASIERAAKGLDLSVWAREVMLRAAGRADLGMDAQAARIRAALSPTSVDPVTGTATDRAEQVRRETGRMPDDVRQHEGRAP